MTFWDAIKCLILRRCHVRFDPDHDEWVTELRSQRSAAEASTRASRSRLTGNMFEDEILPPHRQREAHQ